MKRILVVDDEDQIRESIRGALEPLEYEIIEADNGTTALDLAKSQKPHLIISDVVMDSGSGFLLRELLREDEETSMIPLILMTGNAQGVGAWKSDPDIEYLEKPFSIADLVSAVERSFKRAARKS
ncbi:MAG TPA: response regulator [Bacteroidota bacterium]|nr:response regulator [Bacteroidota bacterium]